MNNSTIRIVAGIASVFEAGIGSARLRAGFRALAFALLFFFPFGVGFLSFKLLPDSLSWLASVSIAMYAVLMLLSELRAQKAAAVFATLLFIGLTVFLAEWASVHTGFPFGSYRYTDALGASVGGVPVAIVLAWYSLLLGAWRISRMLTRHLPGRVRRGAGPLVAATLMLLLDLVMEPIAVYRLGYWTWDSGNIPLSNYATWIVLSGALAFVLDLVFDRSEASRDARVQRALCATSALVFVMQLSLFAITGLAAGFFIEALLALLLTALLLAHFLMERAGDSMLGTAA